MKPEVDLAGRTLAHYRLVQKIGEGGMGVVYRAEDTHLDRSVAIKVLPVDAVADPERKRRFVQEARSASALNHPNIIHIYDISAAEGTDFIAMEYVRGRTLDLLIGRDGLDPRQAVTLAAQMAGASVVAPIRSIAVLPLENLSGNPEQEYFVDGMTDAITTELGKVSGFDKVSAWQSMTLHKKTTKPLGEIAMEVNVDALVQGVVLREGNRVRISPKLFRVNREKQLWANSYDRELREVLSLQSEVAQAIAREVGVSLAGRRPGPSAAVMSVNPEAYDYYLRGIQYLEQRMGESPERLAVGVFQRAVTLDSNFYQAYAKLAYGHSLLWLN